MPDQILVSLVLFSIPTILISDHIQVWRTVSLIISLATTAYTLYPLLDELNVDFLSQDNLSNLFVLLKVWHTLVLVKLARFFIKNRDIAKNSPAVVKAFVNTQWVYWAARQDQDRKTQVILLVIWFIYHIPQLFILAYQFVDYAYPQHVIVRGIQSREILFMWAGLTSGFTTCCLLTFVAFTYYHTSHWRLLSLLSVLPYEQWWSGWTYGEMPSPQLSK